MPKLYGTASVSAAAPYKSVLFCGPSSLLALSSRPPILGWSELAPRLARTDALLSPQPRLVSNKRAAAAPKQLQGPHSHSACTQWAHFARTKSGSSGCFGRSSWPSARSAGSWKNSLAVAAGDKQAPTSKCNSTVPAATRTGQKTVSYLAPLPPFASPQMGATSEWEPAEKSNYTPIIIIIIWPRSFQTIPLNLGSSLAPLWLPFGQSSSAESRHLPSCCLCCC